MTNKQAIKTDKQSGSASMSNVAELRADLIDLAGGREWADNRKSWLSRAARKADISYRTARAIFYRESADPKLSVANKIRAAAQAQKAKQSRAADAQRLLSIASALESRDENFHRQEIAALRDLAARFSGMDRNGEMAKASGDGK